MELVYNRKMQGFHGPCLSEIFTTSGRHCFFKILPPLACFLFHAEEVIVLLREETGHGRRRKCRSMSTDAGIAGLSRKDWRASVLPARNCSAPLAGADAWTRFSPQPPICPLSTGCSRNEPAVGGRRGVRPHPVRRVVLVESRKSDLFNRAS